MKNLLNNKAFVLLWMAILFILAGGVCTYFTAQTVHVHLHEGESNSATNSSFFEDMSSPSSDAASTLPFTIRLDSFDIAYHEGTRAPKDYVSNITILDRGQELPMRISMNKIGRYRHYRIFQEDFDQDLNGSVLLVRYDPWGNTLVYIGYGLLLLSMLWLLFRREGAFRKLIRNASVICLMLFSFSTPVQAQPRLNAEQAEAFGRLSVYYRGRIAPFDSYARDYCKAAFHKGHLPEGYNAVQAVTSVYWSPELWPDKPRPSMRIFPQQDQWFCPEDSLCQIAHGDSICIVNSLSLLQMYVQEGQDDMSMELIASLAKFQEKRCTPGSIQRSKENIEIQYNQLHAERRIALIEIGMAFLMFILYLIIPKRKKTIQILSNLCGIVAFSLNLAVIGLRCYLSGHNPFAGTFDTMLVLSAGILLIAIIAGWQRLYLQLPTLLTSAFILIAALMIGGNSFSPLMPVLISPWLSLHVAITMTSYSLFFLTFILALVGIGFSIFQKNKNIDKHLEIKNISQIFCILGVVLLSIGIIIGSVWANISWGQYWSWDPKETWALITLLGYCTALPKVIPATERYPLLYHILVIVAFILLLMTYFGVNFLLSGMHSYN